MLLLSFKFVGIVFCKNRENLEYVYDTMTFAFTATCLPLRDSLKYTMFVYVIDETCWSIHVVIRNIIFKKIK